MSDTAVLTLTFRYFFFPLFPLFLTHFFSSAGNLVGFILVGNVLRKAFSILELDERKNRPVMEHGFQVNVTCFFASFSVVLDWIVLILVWFERSLHCAQVTGHSCPWSWKRMTSQAVERAWILQKPNLQGTVLENLIKIASFVYVRSICLKMSFLKFTHKTKFAVGSRFVLVCAFSCF